MVVQTIHSPRFLIRGKMTPVLFNRLLVRGGGVHVSDALRRHQWDGQQPYATTIITVDPTSGAIRGARWETRGNLGSVSFNAKDLFAGADPACTITLDFPDLGVLTWISEGDTRNQSTWMDSSEWTTIIRKGEDVLSTEEEVTAAGVSKFCGRFTIMLGDQIDKCVIYFGAVPWSKADLIAKVETLGASVSSPNCPTIAVRLLSKAGKMWHGCPITMGPTESDSEKVGLGHLGLLEMIGAGPGTFPSGDDYEEELTTLLRRVAVTNNVALSRIEALYARPETFTVALRLPKQGFQWMEYRGPVAAGGALGQETQG